MFYAAIKTTRKQHNIIRYVLKILTKKQNLTPCCENYIGSPVRRNFSFFISIVFLRVLISLDFFKFSSDTTQLFGASKRVPPLNSFHIYLYSNKDKFHSKNIIIYQLYVLIYACFLEAFAPKNILFSCVCRGLKNSRGKFMFKCKSSDKLRLNEML